MIEILKENFDDEFLNIQAKFQNAAFFAIDNEFSGLLLRDELSQLNSMDEWYLNQKAAIENYVSLQIGVSAFHFSEKANIYTASTYCFYLFPQSLGSLDAEFLCRASSFAFLQKYKFDFNKLVYHGVPYLSHHDEQKLKKAIETGELFQNLNQFLSYEERTKVQNICSEISAKIDTVKSSRTKETSSSEAPCVKVTKDNEDFKLELSPFLALVTSYEIYQRFPEITIHPESYGMRLEFDSTSKQSSTNYSLVGNTFAERILYSMRGFTRVFDLLIDLKKPIVGHNMLADLMMMVKQFHGPLPLTLRDFKGEVHSLFPTVYDTKFFCTELKRCHKAHFKREKNWETSSLEGLYDYFQDGFRGVRGKILRPIIFKSVGISATGMFHNAAWDSYCTGHIFIRMMHLHAVLSKSMVYEGELPTSEEYLSFTKQQFGNRVNIISGNILYTVLDDEDPTSHRPSYLFVCSKNGTQLDGVQVAKLCSSYGTTSVIQIDRFSAYIVIGSKSGYQRILKNLKNHPDFKIERYSVTRHNKVVRRILWMMIGLTSCSSLYLALSTLSQMRK